MDVLMTPLYLQLFELLTYTTPLKLQQEKKKFKNSWGRYLGLLTIDFELEKLFTYRKAAQNRGLSTC